MALTLLSRWLRGPQPAFQTDPEKGEPSQPGTSLSQSQVASPLEVVVAISSSSKNGLQETQLSIVGMTCSACTSSIYDALSQHPGIASVNISLLTNSATITHDANSVSPEKLCEIVDDVGFEAQVVSIKSLRGFEQPAAEETDMPKRVKSKFSVGGMTCSACTSTLTGILSQLPTIEDLVVSLSTNSCTLTHDPSALPTSVLSEAIEDAGFDAQYVSSEDVAGEKAGPTGRGSKKGKEKEVVQRQVTLKLEELSTADSISSLVSLWSGCGITILSRPTLSSPLVTLSYVPTPNLTIRTILSSIPSPLSASIYRPPTLSELARRNQLRELHQRLILFVLSFLFAIPTFVIGVLGMLLLPSGNRLQAFCMSPVWGGANGGTIVLFCLATPVYFILAAKVFHLHAYLALRAAVRRRPFRLYHLVSFGNMDTLVSLSISVAYWSSIGMLALDVSAGKGNGIGTTYFDSVVFLVFFILMGRCLEARARVMTGDAIALLGRLRPETADLVIPAQNDSWQIESVKKLDMKSEDSESSSFPSSFRTQSIPVSHLEFFDRIMVRPGSLPPADGVIVSGNTSFDESSLTGESVPVRKSHGDEIWTGTTNLTSPCIVEVRALGDQTMLERIVRAVGDAQGRKAPVEKLADRITAVFVPVIIWLSLLVLIMWLATSLTDAVPDSYLAASDLGSGSVLGGGSRSGRVFFSFEFCIAVLVVACPCGIGLAAPTAQAVGAGIAAKMGVLAQGGGEAFQLATNVDTVVFDKTGTITVGEAKVEEAVFLVDDEKSWVKDAVRAIEEGSSHPLALALRAFCSDSINGVDVIGSEEVAGRGAKGTVSVRGSRYDMIVGNEAFMNESGAVWPSSKHGESTDRVLVQDWKAEGKSVVLVATRPSSENDIPARGFNMVALFSISDAPRPDSASSIEVLRRAGKDVWMLSGDNAITARAIARRVGIDEDHVIAGVLPHEKAEHIRTLQATPPTSKRRDGRLARLLRRMNLVSIGTTNENSIVLFCGDGLNDSAAIAGADVGVALGHGSQITVAAADFIILSSSLSTLPSLLHLASRVYRRQKLNFAWALVYNCAALPLAAGVFYPAGHTRLPPVWSALAMALSSVSVVTSSLALRWGL